MFCLQPISKGEDVSEPLTFSKCYLLHRNAPFVFCFEVVCSKVLRKDVLYLQGHLLRGHIAGLRNPEKIK